MSEPMAARQRDHLWHFGRMMEEMAMRGNGNGRRPSAAMPYRISQRKGTLRWLSPTEYRRAIGRNRPIGLHATRPGWIRQRGGGKGLAEGGQRQHCGEKDRLDLYKSYSSSRRPCFGCNLQSQADRMPWH